MDIEAIELLTELIKQKYSGSLVYGSNTPDNGISLRWSSNPRSTFLCKNTYEYMNVYMNGKNTDQLTIVKTMNDIHDYLTRLRNYPSTSRVQICNIETSSGPSLVGREENSQWLYGSTLLIKIYKKGD